MLRKPQQKAYENIESLIAAGVTIKGDIISQGSIRVDGTIEGTMDIKGDLILGDKGKIKGDVKTANFILAGKMEGTVQASERFEITSSGCMVGDVISKIITIEEGGLLHGTSKMSSSRLQAGEDQEKKKKE